MEATESKAENDNSQKHTLENLEGNDNQNGDISRNLEVVKNIKVTISMELGRTVLSIHELLQLSQGSVVELDRMVDEPMDILVNGTLIAHGEVVVIDEKFGIRLTDIVHPMERIKKID